MLRLGNCFLVLALGCAEVFALLGDLAPQLDGPQRIDLVQLRDHSLCLGRAAADDSRRLAIKLAQIRQRGSIAWIEPYGLLKLPADPLGQRKRAEKRGPAGLFAKGAAQPHVIVGVLPVEFDRLFAVVGRSIKLLQGELNAAFEVVGLGLASRPGQRIEQSQRLVCLASLQGCVGLGELRAVAALLRRDRSGQDRCKTQPRQAQPGQRASQRYPHRTTLMGIPSCKGCPLVEPVAT